VRNEHLLLGDDGVIYVGYVANLCYFIVIVLLQGYSKDIDAKRGNFRMFGFEGNDQTSYHRKENYQI